MATSSAIASDPSAYLQCPPSYSRSRSSGSSASSLSSTFSDLTSSTSAYSSSPPTSKTNAFFASPFSTRPPSPDLPARPPPLLQAPRSLTADFFATPARAPSPPAALRTTGTKVDTIHPSRIFPSRYTSTAHRSPEPNLQNLDEGSPNLYSRTRVPSSGSDSSFLSSFVGTRLPTPPPPPPSFPRLLHRDDTITSLSTLPSLTVDDQATPRPPDLEPGLLHFERSLLLAAQEKHGTPQEPEREPELEKDGGEEDEEPRPGSIISLQTPDTKASEVPLSPLSMTFTMASPVTKNNNLLAQDSCSTPTLGYESSCLASDNGAIPSSPSLYLSEPTNGLTHAPTLRLVRSLGHGAFSTVWLAEDLSPVPLTVLSKKSVRNLRRRASGRREQERRRDLGDQTKATAPEFLVEEHEPKARPELTKRTPSRIREGLRNFLSFSRPSATTQSSVSNDQPPTESTSRWIGDAGDLGNALVNSDQSEIPSFQSFEGPSRCSSLNIPLTSNTNGALARDSSLRKFRDRVRGTRPPYRLGRAYLDERHGEMGEMREDDSIESRHGERLGSGDSDSILVSSLSRNSSFSNKAHQRLLAVKMTPRKVRGPRGRERAEEERTRVGFVREVEVLKHISHPNITPLLAHLSTVSHHILVLPYLQGGDLLGLVNNEVAWGKLGESVLQRIWCELCKAVGWMHGVGLVHRDIKLENILMTTPAFASLTPSSPRPTLSSLPSSPAPFIKLTDFGLSRFVEIDAHGEAELLTTRCGSEAYAAPELVTGGRGAYDARQTDAWACGVVLYALVGRQLPFGEGVRAQVPGSVGHGIGGERGADLSAGKASAAERRQWLMRIARGEYEWPGDQPSDAANNTSKDDGHDQDGELVGPQLIHSAGARRIASRLLVRDPQKRARIGDLWDDGWMYVGDDQMWFKDCLLATAEGEVASPVSMSMSSWDGSREHDMEMLSPIDLHHHNRDQDGEWTFDKDQLDHSQRLLYAEDSGERMNCVDQYDEEEEEEGGWLLDQEGIDNIARQEVI